MARRRVALPAERCPTARVIEALWTRWSRRYRQQHGHAISKGSVSVNYFEGDRNLLARWTSAADRPRWRFPLARLDELVTTFEMTQGDIDDLVTARIEELQDDEETARLLTWLASFLDRTALDNEERQVLDAWRAARAGRQLGFYNDGRQQGELRRLFDGLLGIHQARHLDEQAHARAQDEGVAPQQRQELSERAKAAGHKYASTKASQVQLVRAKHETKALLARLRTGKHRCRRSAQSLAKKNTPR